MRSERYHDYETLICPGCVWIVEYQTNRTGAPEAHWEPYHYGHVRRVVERNDLDLYLPGSKADALRVLLLMAQDAAGRGRNRGVVMRALYDIGRRRRIIIPLPE